MFGGLFRFLFKSKPADEHADSPNQIADIASETQYDFGVISSVPDVEVVKSLKFNESLGFLNFYQNFVQENEEISLYESYGLAQEQYEKLSERRKKRFRRMKLTEDNIKFRESFTNNDAFTGDGCAGTYEKQQRNWCDYEVDENDFDISSIWEACAKKQKSGCGDDCPPKRGKSTCVEPGICESMGFKNFLAAFRRKNDQMSRCSALAMAKPIYAGMDECEKKPSALRVVFRPDAGKTVCLSSRFPKQEDGQNANPVGSKHSVSTNVST